MIRGRAEKRTDPAVEASDEAFDRKAVLEDMKFRRDFMQATHLRDVIARIEREEEVYSPFRTVNS